MDLLKKLAIAVIAVTAGNLNAMDDFLDTVIDEVFSAGVNKVISYIDDSPERPLELQVLQTLFDPGNAMENTVKTALGTIGYVEEKYNQIRARMAETKADLRQRAEDNDWNDDQKRSANEMYEHVGDGIPFLHRSNSSQVFDLD